jgi:hypothetical protein
MGKPVGSELIAKYEPTGSPVGVTLKESGSDF